MDREARSRGGGSLSGEGHGFPGRDGRARPVPQALPGLRFSDPAHRLCRERVELLRPMPDRRETAVRPTAGSPAEAGLASDPGGAGGTPRADRSAGRGVESAPLDVSAAFGSWIGETQAT